MSEFTLVIAWTGPPLPAETRGEMSNQHRSAAPTWSVAFHVGLDRGRARVEVAGELDHVTAVDLAEALDEVIRWSRGDVVVGTGGVTFCDARGLNCLVAAHATLARAGRRLRVVDCPARLRRLLALAETEFLLG